MSRLEELKQNPLFKNVPEEPLCEVLQVMIERQFRAGQIIIEQDAHGETLHLITKGIVRVSRMRFGSRERVMGDVYAPAVLGETAVLQGHSERSATVRALTDVTSFMLYRTHFQQLLQRYPAILWNLSVILVERITYLNDELIALGLNTEAALSYIFINLYQQRLIAGVPNPEVLPMTTIDIMQRISSSRETALRVMRKLEHQGILKTTSHTITLLDPEALGNVALSELESEDY